MQLQHYNSEYASKGQRIEISTLSIHDSAIHIHTYYILSVTANGFQSNA